jgi:predicted TIM-barrel fold metal-dependent hydrolase
MKPINTSSIAREYIEKGFSADCPLIDMHGHWGTIAGAYLPSTPEERMLRTLKRAGVKKIVCSGMDALLADPEKGNALMQEVINRHPDLIMGYWAINPNYPTLVDRAIGEFENSKGFAGFKFLPDYHVYPLTGKLYRGVLEYADAHKLPVLIHTWGGSAHNSPQQVEQIAKDFPNAILMMGHSGFGDWENSVRVARDCANVYLELTAVYVAHDFAMLPAGSGTPLALASCLHVNGIIEYMVEHASSRKILFGTDMPWYSPWYAAGAVLFAKISDDARRDIFYRNAERLLELKK